MYGVRAKDKYIIFFQMIGMIIFRYKQFAVFYVDHIEDTDTGAFAVHIPGTI